MISLLRFIAMLLITNSHFGVLYPNGFSVLATGGAIGNSLFMFCSGYALYASLIKLKSTNKESETRKMYNWLLKRFLRIYPSVWLFRLFQILALGATFRISILILPGYWFLNAILLFYVLFYLIVYYFEKHLTKFLFLLLIPFLIVFFIQPNLNTEFIVENTGNRDKLHWYYYFAIMLFGALVYKNEAKWVKPQIWGGVKLLIALVMYYGFKGLILHTELYFVQFLTPIFLFPVMIYFTDFCSYLIKRRMYKKVEKGVVFLSNITLDVYIVQFIVISFMQHYKFPIGFILAWLIIFSGGIILYFASKKVNEILFNKLIAK